MTLCITRKRKKPNEFELFELMQPKLKLNSHNILMHTHRNLWTRVVEYYTPVVYVIKKQ